MIKFTYSRISNHLLNNVAAKIRSGESIVFIGPRYCGKNRILHMVYERLSEKNLEPIIRLQSPDQDEVASEDNFRDWLNAGLSKLSLPKNSGISLDDGDIFAPIDIYYNSTGNPVIIVAGKIDNMPHRFARRFLEGVRVRVEKGSMIVALSGEDDFKGLVYGPNSKFNCANQYIIQGFSMDVFSSIVKELLTIVDLHREVGGAVIRKLYEKTGGQIFLLRVILWTLAENRDLHMIMLQKPFSFHEISASIDSKKIPSSYASHLGQHAYKTILQEPNEWEYLEQLIETDQADLNIKHDGPTSLELSGIAVRDQTLRKLNFSSPLLKSFYKKYFSPCRIGDMYAEISDWENAFRWYDKIPGEEQSHRPFGVDDRVAITTTINSFCSTLHMKAAENTEVLNDFFITGCKKILGLTDIMYWSWKNSWELRYPPRIEFKPETIDGIKETLDAHSDSKKIFVDFPYHMAKYMIGIKLPTSIPETNEFLIVGNYSNECSLSLFQKNLIEKLLRHYHKAYSNATNAERNRIRLEIGDQHVAIINDIFDEILNSVNEVDQILKMAAQRLRQLGYGKVLFSLVDSGTKKIEGVVYDCGEEEIEIKLPVWPLSDSNNSLQKEVWKTKQYQIVDNSERHRLTRDDPFFKNNIQSCAVIPVLDRHINVIGTILVEKEDGTSPRKEEVKDLEMFARQLAIAIIKNERIIFLQSVLDQSDDAIVVWDGNKRIRYVNEAGGMLFGCPFGWVLKHNTLAFKKMKIGKIWPKMNKTLDTGERSLEHIDGLGVDGQATGKVLFDTIKDWRGQSIGVLLHVQDLTYLTKISNAFETVASASDSESAMESTLKAMESLGANWGRFYIIDSENPDCLVSKYSYGIEDDDLEEKFRDGKLILRREKSWESWISFKEGKPIVLSYLPENKDKWNWKTQSGLDVTNVRNPGSAPFLNKKPGVFWLEFPIVIKGKPYAKLSVECSQDMPPDNYELLKMLCRMCKKLLGSFLDREKISKEKERLTFEIAEKANAITAHNIKTRLASLPILLKMYEMEEKDHTEISKLNRRFKTTLSDIFSTITRTMEMVSIPKPDYSRFDVIELLNKIFCINLEEKEWCINTMSAQQFIEGDPALLRNAISEIISNSKSIIDGANELLILVRIKLDEQADMVRISITDNGPGVPPKIKTDIFDDFYTHRPGKKPGLGLGLSYVKRVIHAHNGTIEEKGVANSGAMFVINLPLKRKY